MRARSSRALVALAIGAVLVLAVLVAVVPRYRRDVGMLVLPPWLRPAYLGDGGPATDLLLCYPMGLAINREGELLVSDRGRGRRGRVVWRIDREGIAHNLVGSGKRGNASSSRALDLRLRRPEALAVATDGSLLLSDGFNHAVYRIEQGGRVHRFAGTGVAGFSGDGGAATDAMLFRPADIRLDPSGNLYIADVRNHRVRRVDPAGRITTVAGTGTPGFSPDGTVATQAQLDTPWGFGLDLEGRLLIGDGGNHRVRLVDDDGRLVTIAGNGVQGFDGDGGLAIEASLNFPEALAMDGNGRLFIGDEWNNAVRVVDTDGIISTVIGTGFPGRAQNGGVARVSPVDDPENVIVTPEGLIIADGNNGRVIRVAADGIVHIVAGRSETASCFPWW